MEFKWEGKQEFVNQSLSLLQDSQTLAQTPEHHLVRRFTIKNKGKLREVNDPIPELKTILKKWNGSLTDYYMYLLQVNHVDHVAHAYLPNKSINTNVQMHLYSSVIQFDFKGFYDSCRFDYFKNALYDLDPSLNNMNDHAVKRLLIDSRTGGLTQGLPVSGALAGIALIPFWVELRKSLPKSIRFTQYSDDLTFSFIGRRPEIFNVPSLTQKIYEALKQTNLNFKLNESKTRLQKQQYRKVTGIRINHHNQTTPSREDYRFLRHALHILSKTKDLEKELEVWGFSSKSAFVGKISYMRSIDSTSKIDRLIMKYRTTCQKHDIFTTWIAQNYKKSAFA